MSLAPAFQIGLWNAWILMVLLFAASFVPLYIDNRRVQKRSEGEPTWSELSRASKTALVVSHAIIMPFTFLYSIVLPLKLGTFWFLAGLPVCLVFDCPAWRATRQRRLRHLETSWVLWVLSGACRRRNSLRLLGFHAMRAVMDSLVALWSH
jgi:hypothetical protein